MFNSVLQRLMGTHVTYQAAIDENPSKIGIIKDQEIVSRTAVEISTTYPADASAAIVSAQSSIQSANVKAVEAIVEAVRQLKFDIAEQVDAEYFRKLESLVDNLSRGQNPQITLQQIKNSLRSLETEFTENFKDPANDFPFNSDFAGAEHPYRSCALYSKKLALARRIETYYKLPKEILDTAISSTLDIETKIGDQEPHYPLARFTGQINTLPIFEQSETLYGINHGLGKWEKLKESDKQRNSLFRESFDKLVRELLPTDENGVLIARERGLAQALKIHLGIMKNFEPDSYQLCLAAAKRLSTQNPDTESPLMIIPMSAHHSEEYLTSHLLPTLSQQKNIDLSRCPIYLFVNGNNSKRISTIIQEINQFVNSQSSGSEIPKLNIKVITGEPSQWGMGLKSIPLNVGIMNLILSGSLSRSDADIPVVSFDSDIVEIPDKDALAVRTEMVRSGKILYAGGYDNSLKMLQDQNINYRLLEEIHREMQQAKNWREGIEKAGIEIKKEMPVYAYGIMGGNSACSLMVLALCGGIKPYSVHDDVEMGQVVLRQITGALGPRDKKDLERQGIYIDRTDEDKVILDGGSVSRAVGNGFSITQQFDTHEHNTAASDLDLSPLNYERPSEVNVERLGREIEMMLSQIVDCSLMFVKLFTDNEQAPDEQAWREELNGVFTQKISEFADRVNEILESLPQHCQFSTGYKPVLELTVKYDDAKNPPIIQMEFGDKISTIDIIAIKSKFQARID